MMMPERIQLSRRKGWKMPPNTMKVDRSTIFGNPFAVTEERTAADAVRAFRAWLTVPGNDAGRVWQRRALLDALPMLRGKNVACWCGPDAACHADVLLELANRRDANRDAPV